MRLKLGGQCRKRVDKVPLEIAKYLPSLCSQTVADGAWTCPLSSTFTRLAARRMPACNPWRVEVLKGEPGGDSKGC